MPLPSKSGKLLLSAAEIGTFTVCEEQWRLKHLEGGSLQTTESAAQGARAHDSWGKKVTEAVFLQRHTLFLAGLVCLATIVHVFLNRSPEREYLLGFSSEVLLAVLVFIACLWWVVRSTRIFVQQSQQASGVSGKPIQVDGSPLIPARLYLSETLGLRGTPDGVVRENKIFIPVEHKPLSKKIRDRHVAQLLVYLRLIEEAHGVKPPYGYLILGKNHKKITIENSAERQQWLQRRIDKMVAITHGARAIPSPEHRKCAGCPVRARCDSAAEQHVLNTI